MADHVLKLTDVEREVVIEALENWTKDTDIVQAVIEKIERSGPAPRPPLTGQSVRM